MNMTPEQRAFAERIQGCINDVSGKILAAVPDADERHVGGLFDAYGSASWNPRRDPSLDYSAWGDWEVWEECRIEDVTAKPTTWWIAWNSASGVPGQQGGFPNRETAEIAAVLANGGGKRTRVVHAGGGFHASAKSFEEIAAKAALVQGDVEAALERAPQFGG